MEYAFKCSLSPTEIQRICIYFSFFCYLNFKRYFVQALHFCPLPLGVTIGLISVHVNNVLLDLYPYSFDLISPQLF